MGWQALVCSLLTCTVLLGSPVLSANRVDRRQCSRPESKTTIYDFELPNLLETRNISLSKYRGKQEPGENGTEILNGIKYVRPGKGFKPNFQLFHRIDVNGEKEHPLFSFLKSVCPPTRDEFNDKMKLFYTPIRSNDIRWNFEKILVDRNGMPKIRYDRSVKPEDMKDTIRMILAKRRTYL